MVVESQIVKFQPYSAQNGRILLNSLIFWLNIPSSLGIVLGEEGEGHAGVGQNLAVIVEQEPGQDWQGAVYLGHTDRFRNNSVTIEFDEVLSCFKLLQAALDIGGNNIDLDKTMICRLQTIQIPIQKSWICCRFYFENTLSKSM